MGKLGRKPSGVLLLSGVVVFFLALPAARAVPGLAGARPGAAPSARSAASSSVYVPAAAHAAGANGASWRTDLEVHNPAGQAVGFTLALLKRDSENTSPDTRSFTVAARTSVRFADVLASAFSFDGAAALRVVPASGTLTVTSRTYNLIGPNPWNLPEGSSFGQFVPGIAEEKAIAFGEEGRLIQLTQRDAASLTDFRTNVGTLNVTAATIDLRVDFYRADGVHLGTRQGDETRLRPYEFRQMTEAFKPFGTIADGYAVLRTTTPGGRFLAFATVIDNHYSGDPIFVPASRVVPAATPAPSPTPTATPTPTPAAPRPNLFLYKPPDWAGCVVCDWTSTCCPPVTQFLSEWYDTYAHLIVANNGAVDVTGPVVFGVSVDGASLGTATWSNPTGVKAGAGEYVRLKLTAGMVKAGRHTLTVTIDPANALFEGNEGDNACSFSGEWTAIVLSRAGAPPSVSAPLAPALSVEAAGPASIGGRQPSAAASASGEELWVPAAAHAAGANGASWRTDLEVHNPGLVAATYTIALLERDKENTSPRTQTFSLDPQKSVRYVDVLDSVFGFTGAAALRIVPTAGTVLATSRTYNLIGPNPWNLPEGSSFGQFVPGLPEADAISSTEEGRLVQLSQRDAASGLDFRTNIGFVNTTGATVDVRLDLYKADGSYLGTRQGDDTRLAPYGFRQISEVFGPWGPLPAAYAVIRPTTAGGRIFAFATVIDNHASGDPIFVPAARMAASAPPTPTPTPTATPGPIVITGPGGSSVTLPPDATSSGATVTLGSGNGSTLPGPGETLVSTVVATDVSGTGVAVGNGTFVVALPVTGTVTDPEKLVLKVATSNGPVYPVAGVFDTATRTFRAEVMKVWDGWTLGVVTSPGTGVTSTASLAPAGGVSPFGWVTPTDWQTCEFRVFNNAPSAPASFATNVASAMKKACEHLRGAEFRSPKLWIDGRWSPKARAIHLVQGTGPNAPSTSFSQWADENAANFSMAGFTDEQMHSLGQVYFNWSDWAAVVTPNGWSYGNVAIHELFHAVQSGYDFRDSWQQAGGSWQHTAMGIMEGTATLVGQMYQSSPNGVYGGTVTVRSPEPPQKLDQAVLWHCCVEAYARQDFFAYVAKRWNGGSLRDLRWLFQHLSDQTNGQFGRSWSEYFTLYQKAMDTHYRSAFGISLPDLYAEFVRDRAYRHDTPALLRPADEALKTSSLDPSLFSTVHTWDPAKAAPLELKAIDALSSRAVKVPVSEADRTARELTMNVAVAGARVGKEGVRLFVFPEKDGVLEVGRELEVTDVTNPIAVAVGPDTTTLTVLAVNGSVTDEAATVTFGALYSRLSLGRTMYFFLCATGDCTGVTCGYNIDDEEGRWVGPLVFAGDTFTLRAEGATLTGKLSTDRKVLLSFRYSLGDLTLIEWANLPLDPSRTTATQLVFAAAGEAARSHIVVAHPFICDSTHSGVDFDKTVRLELLLGP